MTQAASSRRGAFDSDLAVRADGPTTWRLLRPLIWTGTRGDTFTVPAGFVTDFATVPRFLHWLISPYGAYTRAAVLHDWLLTELAQWHRTHPLGGRETWDTSRPPANSRDADGIFRRVMQDLGVDGPTRWTMWTAVRWASLFSPSRAYGRGILRDLPAMLGVSLLALVPVALGAVPVLAALLLLRLATGLIRLVRPGRSGH